MVLREGDHMNAEDVVMRAVTEGWFSVRDDGTVWRIAQRRKSRLGIVTVEPLEHPHRVDSPMSAGYLGVKFMVDGKQVYCLAHRLVWRVFKGSIPASTFEAAMRAADVKVAAQIIWVKPWLVLGRGQYHWRHEPAWFGWVNGHQPPDFGERNQTTVWEVDPISSKDRAELNHATPKPVKLFELPITKHTKTGEIVFEAFAGSGPQFIAAEQLGRRCFGVEFEPQHVSAIIKRWEKLTGRKAEKVS